MAALGQCGNLTPSTFISVNEVTTVGATYGLADYMTSLSAIGSGASDAAALTNAFTFALELVNPSTGSAPGASVPAGTTIPVAQINTIADAMAACINSPGGVSGDGSACGTFIALTTPTGTTPPTNSIGALLNLALNPTLNTTAIYNLVVPSSPFQPTDPTVPVDLSVRPNTSGTLQLSTNNLVFPPQTVGYISPDQTVTIQNTGASTATFSPMTISGIDSADFAQISSCSTLAPGASCQIQLTVTPGALGTRVAALTVTSNTAASPQTISLSASGTTASAGPITVSPTSINTSYAGLYNDVTLSNFGTTALSIKSVTVNSPYFSVAANNCGMFLAPQSVCTISVVSLLARCNGGACPGSPETASGTLTVTDDASAGPQTVALSSANTETVDGSIVFPATAVGSTATSAAGVAGYEHDQQANFAGTLTGANPGDFSASVLNPNPPPTYGCLGQGFTPVWEGCNFAVTFTPTAAGTRTAKLQNASGNGYILLTGTGMGATGFTVPSALDLNAYINYSGVAATSGIVTIVNTGSTTLDFASPQLFGSNPTVFALSGNCTAVAPGTSCPITVTLNATGVTTATTYSGTLTLTDSASGQTQNVGIFASVRYSSPYFSASTFAFGSVPVGTTSPTMNFTITDINGSPLGHPIQLTWLNGVSTGYILPLGSTCPASTTTVCTLGIAFQPPTVGVFHPQLVATDTTTGYTAAASPTGTGTPPPGTPTVSLSATSLTFPLRASGTTSVPMSVNVTNTGTAVLSVSTVSILGAVNNNYTQTNNCGAVAINNSCTINVTFAPTATGTQTATVQILSNAPSSPDTISITGSAN